MTSLKREESIRDSHEKNHQAFYWPVPLMILSTYNDRGT